MLKQQSYSASERLRRYNLIILRRFRGWVHGWVQIPESAEIPKVFWIQAPEAAVRQVSSLRPRTRAPSAHEMTYVDLYHKAIEAFDPEHRGNIQGYPVEVMYKMSRLADAQGWEQPVDTVTLRQRLSADYLDRDSVTKVLNLI